MIKVYYAHGIYLYGTEQEQRDLALLYHLGLQVFNPNSVECDEGYKHYGMDYFRKPIDECDVLAFRSLPDGRIPGGMAYEIEWAKIGDKPIFELPSNILGRGLDKGETREYLKECGYR